MDEPVWTLATKVLVPSPHVAVASYRHLSGSLFDQLMVKTPLGTQKVAVPLQPVVGSGAAAALLATSASRTRAPIKPSKAMTRRLTRCPLGMSETYENRSSGSLSSVDRERMWRRFFGFEWAIEATEDESIFDLLDQHHGAARERAVARGEAMAAAESASAGDHSGDNLGHRPSPGASPTARSQWWRGIPGWAVQGSNLRPED